MADTGLNEDLGALGEMIAAALPGKVERCYVDFGELNVVADAAGIVGVIQHLASDSACMFINLIDITAVDYPAREQRFDVVYHLLSPKHNRRIRVKAAVAEDGAIPSIVGVFPSANWFEREAYDMFGVIFTGHPDLRRILTDYGFDGYPLRKDFPMTGLVEVRYDDAQKRVVNEPVKLTQDYRQFDFLSPWEGADYVLPGDEKAKG
ncbi:MAG: NADH-quinone oxidoreductase subunit C [Beijerinckiaceae bacterium]